MLGDDGTAYRMGTKNQYFFVPTLGSLRMLYLIRVQLILKASVDGRDNSRVFENPIYYCLVSCGALS